jgi:hypothetical protein
MGLDDLIGKAKDALEGNEDKVASGLDTAADFIKDRTDDSVDEKVDVAVDKAKEFLADQKD